MAAPSVGVFFGLFGVPPSAMSEHAPMVSVNIITGHFWLAITSEIGESSPECIASAPSSDVSRVDGSSKTGISVGKSVPMPSGVVRAGLISSSITVEISILDIGTSMSAPSGTEFIGSGVWSADEMVMEIGFKIIHRLCGIGRAHV